MLIRARVDGTIDRIAFTEGQDVKPGDLLAIIDPRPYQAVYDQAVAKKAADTATLANAKRDLARYSDLARSDFASRQSVDTQTASVSQATANTQSDDAAIAAAKLNLDFTRITSPIEGRVGLRLVDVGNLVHAGDANGIVTINQIHPISVLFTLPQDHVPGGAGRDPHVGRQPLTVRAFARTTTAARRGHAADAGQRHRHLDRHHPAQGRVRQRRRPAVARGVRQRAPAARHSPSAVTVPSAAVQHGVDGLYVYVVKPDGTAALTPVVVGQDDAGVTVVTKGLAGDETVVTAGQSRLTDGTRVATHPRRSRRAVAPVAASTGG